MADFLNENRELFAAIVGGIIGIIGSIATMVASHYLRLSGNITVNLNSIELELLKSDNVGGETTAESVSESERMSCSISVDVYNSSDVPKSLRSISLEFSRKAKMTNLSLTPSVHNKGGGMWNQYAKLNIINLSPKELIHLELKCWVGNKDLNSIKGKTKIYFKGLYPNGRKFIKHLNTSELK